MLLVMRWFTFITARIQLNSLALMAIVAPFRALRYDPDRVSVRDVVTQPYDKITPAMQDRYYAASAYNLCRIILRKSEPQDKTGSDVYSRAAKSFAEWRSEGVLQQDAKPSIYLYQQRFTVPGTQTPGTREGFIALLRLEDYAAGVVHRHEQTLSRPKEDRLNLLRATRAHFGQIFMVYEGEAVSPASPTTRPAISVEDEYGVEHRLWCISDQALIARISAEMLDKRMIIADGHHRYETALAFRDEQRRASAVQAGSSDPAYEYVMATFISMNSPGLLILPTHRVVHGLTTFETGTFVEKVRAHFTIRDVSSLMPRMNGTGPHFEVETARKLLRCELQGEPTGDRSPESGDSVMLAVTHSSTFLLYSNPKSADPVLAGIPELERRLDVVQLHKIILEGALRMSGEDIREQRHIKYVREPEEAAREVAAGANVAFLMNPVRIEQMGEIAFQAGVLPQKSTDFYPKLLSGLTVYALDAQ